MPPSEIEDICFNPNTFWIINALTVSLTGAIGTLFGLLMLSKQSQIKAAETRESQAIKDRDEAYKQRDQAATRMEETRRNYRSLVEELRSRDVEPRWGDEGPRWELEGRR